MAALSLNFDEYLQFEAQGLTPGSPVLPHPVTIDASHEPTCQRWEVTHDALD